MSIRRIIFPLFLALVACGSLAARAQKPACLPGDITTTSGRVCGTTSSSSIDIQGERKTFTASAYLGIPYAQSPVGKMRWQNPEDPKPWQDTFQATELGNACPQRGATTKGGVCSFTTDKQSEDCLYLNVWVPNIRPITPSLPVMVFIHGGAFDRGTGSSNLYEGTYLAASQNVIVVTFNYRLGVLGFLATRDMANGAGNFGFSDQLMALKWVHKNIGRFGGDPSQVMLFGESAGAMSVGLHALSSPQSAGLFKAALMESNPLGIPYKTLDQARIVGDSYRKQVECSSLQCLQQKSACELVAHEDFLGLKDLFLPARSDIFHWTPVLDGILISGQPIANATNLKVPMLMGTNGDEGLVFAALAQKKTLSLPAWAYVTSLNNLFGFSASQEIRSKERYRCGDNPDCTTQLANVITDSFFTCANRRLAIQAGSAQNLYMYLFNQVTSFNFWASPNPTVVADCDGKVCHADELPYVFNTAQAMAKSFEPVEEELSQTMGGYWASFAKSQSPDRAWPVFNRSNKTYLILKANPLTVDDPLDTDANCTLWDKIGYQSSATWDRLLAEVNTPKKKPAH